MKDLLLWRLLHEENLQVELLGPLLKELAAWPVKERVAFFGPLPRLLEHDDESLRAAAVAVLQGAVGPLAFRHIIRALHDPTPSVRLAAVETLRESAQAEPYRWVHALFHSDAEVRQAALAGKAVAQVEWMTVHLLADSTTSATVVGQLSEQVLPARTLPVVLDQLTHGIVSRPLARRWIARMPWEQCLQGLNKAGRRDPELVAQLLDLAAGPHTEGEILAAAGHDALDDVLDLFWDPNTEAEADSQLGQTPTTAFFDHFCKQLLVLENQEPRRLITALMVTAARRGFWQPAAAGACAVHHPPFLSFSWVPREVRRAAVRALYELGERCPRLSNEAVQELLQMELCRRRSGNLDLWVVGGILHFLRSGPYQNLESWFGIKRIVSAFLEDIEDSVPFLALKDDSDLGRQYLIDQISRQRRPRQAFMLALLVHTVSADDLEFLERLNGQEAAAVFEELLALAGRFPRPMAENKSRQVADILGTRLVRNVKVFLQCWLKMPAPEESILGVKVLAVVARELDSMTLIQHALALAPPALRNFLKTIAWCPGFPYGKEVELAQVLASHRDEDVRSWAAHRIPAAAKPATPRQPSHGHAYRVKPAAMRDIATCSEARLAKAVECCLTEPLTGLAYVLSLRPDPAGPNLTVCVALLGAHDPIDQVGRQLQRFGSSAASFLARLEARAVETWHGQTRLPLLGHAWLFRWDEHCFAFGALLREWPGGLVEAMRFLNTLASEMARQRIWEALALLLSIWRFRERQRLVEVANEALGALLVEQLTFAEGEAAARVLVTLHESNAVAALMESLKPRVAALLPDLAGEVRRLLSDWIDSRGLVTCAGQADSRQVAVSRGILERIRQCSDLGQLRSWCRDGHPTIVEEAALRLLEWGEDGLVQLVGLLRETPPPPCVNELAGTIALWPGSTALHLVSVLVEDPTVSARVRFRIGLALLERGEREALPRLLDAACQEGEPSWFRPEDWQRLLGLGVPVDQMATALAVSPQPYAYGAAIEHFLSLKKLEPPSAAVLLAFLEVGTERRRDLRLRAARRLHEAGNHAAFPLLLNQEMESLHQLPTLLKGVPQELVATTVTAVLMAGHRLFPKSRLLDLLQHEGVDPDADDEGCRRLLVDATSLAVRNAVLARLRRTASRDRKLRQVAETFAWGIREGRALTGNLFTVQMIAGDDLGYTRFEENRIYINPLPILRTEQHGDDVVRGLILHELGHHVYHRGPEALPIWKEAGVQGLHPLLNLVSDEHLERNLRAGDPDHGDKLKKLTAYAFQHVNKDVPVLSLLDGLQGRAFAVLSAARLGPARRAGCVAVESGALLHEMEKAGMSFARFMRALRMGLGNRQHDPKVDEGLALFRGKFRQSSMAELFEKAKRLREIFGTETELLNALGQEAVLNPEAGEVVAAGEGLSNAEIQEEIDRILDPRTARSGTDPKSGRRWINVSPDEKFQPIPTVVPVPFDPAQHKVYAERVARPARHMRRYLQQLGLTLEPQRGRLRGRSLDRTSLRDVVLRGDPRMLVARELRVQTDLFLGVLIDCSGSMRMRDHIDKAKLFGTLLAEAARDFRGIDLRLFGFTDKVIYDAGSAARCAAHALEASDGNNDAAALWHAAQIALESRRKARLLVMISDGLPTECSVAALKALVSRLTHRWRICCAQVAVQPLAEVCFPHYVLLQEADLDSSVRRFGQVVARLVRRAIRR